MAQQFSKRGGMTAQERYEAKKARLRYPQSRRQAVMTLQEVALIMTARGFPMTKGAVEETEARALFKLWKALLEEGQS